ncbi:MAG: hypothetical protein WA047_10150 [Phenylobacterium sp.]|uniref:hypothetical protein n=1 Tax=Phenylobacterium sp. TaxID=1871053 RepID=UPI003BB74330
MPAYTFFPYLAGGPGLTFEAVELSDDDAAVAQALKVLAEHGSAAEVEIWRDDELIHRERRGCGGGLSSPSAAGRNAPC